MGMEVYFNVCEFKEIKIKDRVVSILDEIYGIEFGKSFSYLGLLMDIVGDNLNENDEIYFSGEELDKYYEKISYYTSLTEENWHEVLENDLGVDFRYDNKNKKDDYEMYQYTENFINRELRYLKDYFHNCEKDGLDVILKCRVSH